MQLPTLHPPNSPAGGPTQVHARLLVRMSRPPKQLARRRATGRSPVTVAAAVGGSSTGRLERPPTGRRDVARPPDPRRGNLKARVRSTRPETRASLRRLKSSDCAARDGRRESPCGAGALRGARGEGDRQLGWAGCVPGTGRFAKEDRTLAARSVEHPTALRRRAMRSRECFSQDRLPAGRRGNRFGTPGRPAQANERCKTSQRFFSAAFRFSRRRPL